MDALARAAQFMNQLKKTIGCLTRHLTVGWRATDVLAVRWRYVG
jgi:hypothetical protein